MKKLSTAVVCIFACIFLAAKDFVLPRIPARMDTPEKRIDYIAGHFWKNFDVGETVLDEQVIVDFLSVTSEASEKARNKAVKSYVRLIRKSSELRETGEMYIEKYLYDRRSPLFNEALFEQILRSQGGRRADFLLEQIAKNREGSTAADFQYFTKENRRFHLTENYDKSDYILLVFYDKSCENCQSVLQQLGSSRELETSCTNDKLKIIAVDISVEEKGEWLTSPADLPSWCESAMLGELDFFDSAKYYFEEIPALYLLDRYGKVLVKQADVYEIIAIIDNY